MPKDETFAQTFARVFNGYPLHELVEDAIGVVAIFALTWLALMFGV